MGALGSLGGAVNLVINRRIATPAVHVEQWSLMVFAHRRLTAALLRVFLCVCFLNLALIMSGPLILHFVAFKSESGHSGFFLDKHLPDSRLISTLEAKVLPLVLSGSQTVSVLGLYLKTSTFCPRHVKILHGQSSWGGIRGSLSAGGLRKLQLLPCCVAWEERTLLSIIKGRQWPRALQ